MGVFYEAGLFAINTNTPGLHEWKSGAKLKTILELRTLPRHN